MRKINSIMICVVLLIGCAKTVHVQHPGAVNAFDSNTYDVLIGVKAVIDTAREQYKAGTLPANLVPIIDRLSKAYNVSYPSWKIWRDAMIANQPADQYLAALNKNMLELSAALDQFKRGK